MDVSNLNLNEAYYRLPYFRRSKVDNFHFTNDKKLSAGAYLLLEKLLHEVGIEKPTLKYGKYGKAYISNFEDIYFNLTHSKKMVSCAISDREVGVDVEYIDPTIDLNIAKNYFYNEEYESIINSQNPVNDFFKYWVLKESYMKYTGLGFQLNLNEFTIEIKNEIKLKGNDKLKFSLFNLEEYKLGVCSSYKVKNVIKYNVNQLEV